MMSAQADYHNVTAWLEGCERPLLLTHQRPDGDALGALAGMGRALGQLGKEPAVVLFEPFPARYALLQAAVTWHQWPAAGERLAARCDAVVILDTCAFAQLEPVADFLPRAPRTLVLDHHATSDAIGTRPADLRLLDKTAGAVCLLVAEWARSAGVQLDAQLATALFTGLATDCGWFRFPSTDARVLHLAADLIDAGAAPRRVFAAIYEQDSPARLRLMGRMLQSLELHADGRLAVMAIRQADFAAAGASGNVTEELVNEAGRLANTEATVLFTEEPGEIRINFRSKRTLDVAALAARFGGGGHARAAGARLKGAWERRVPEVLAATVAALMKGPEQA